MLLSTRGMEFDPLSREVIGACIDVHREVGPGLLESVYAQCLALELTLRGLRFEREVAVPLAYKGQRIGVPLRADFVVEGALILEAKAIETIQVVHVAQLTSYLRLSGLTVGLLVNFNVPVLREGLRRVVNGYRPPRGESR